MREADKGRGESSKRAESSGTESSSDFGPQGVEYKGEFYGEAPYFIGIGTWTPETTEEESVLLDKDLDTVETAIMVCILEDAVDELVILKYVIGAPSQFKSFYYRTIKERYTRRLTPEGIFPEADGKPLFTSEVKLQRERDHAEKVLLQTLETLLGYGCYDPLEEAVETVNNEEEDDVRLIQELKRNLEYLKDLKKRVEEKRRLDDLEEKEREELKYYLQDEMDDIILKCQVEETFVNKWENVRNAQNLWKLRNAENYFKDNIGKLSVKTKLEKRVTNELQLYLKLNQTELEEELEEWMGRYDSEMERRENKILHLKYNRDQEEEKKHSLQQLYENRKTEMKNWIAFRTVRNRRIKASLQIQSWWRGIMVRKKLGPYKPRKQQKAEKKKK